MIRSSVLVNSRDRLSGRGTTFLHNDNYRTKVTHNVPSSGPIIISGQVSPSLSQQHTHYSIPPTFPSSLSAHHAVWNPPNKGSNSAARAAARGHRGVRMLRRTCCIVVVKMTPGANHQDDCGHLPARQCCRGDDESLLKQLSSSSCSIARRGPRIYQPPYRPLPTPHPFPPPKARIPRPGRWAGTEGGAGGLFVLLRSA